MTFTLRRPTRRGLTLLLGSLALLLAAVTAQAGWLYVVAAGALGVLLASFVVPHRLTRVSVERSVAPAVSVGGTLEVRLKLHNGSRRPVRLVLVRDLFPGLAPAAWLCDRIERGTSASASLRVPALTRGVYEGGPVELSCGWPFGLARSCRRQVVGSSLVVLPRVIELSRLPVEVTARSLADTRPAVVLGGPGTEFAGVREYRPGDPLRAVHWRSSARRDDLVVRELHDETPGHLLCVLGGRDSGRPPDSPFEALVEAAASIVAHARAAGHRVTVARAGVSGENVTLTDASLPAALRWLAEAQPVDRLLGPVREGLARAGRDATAVLLISNTGRVAEELPSAVRTATAAGGRALVVVARAETWGSRSDGRAPAPPGGLDDRAIVRTLARGEGLDKCLAG